MQAGGLGWWRAVVLICSWLQRCACPASIHLPQHTADQQAVPSSFARLCSL